jgi:hypothetical protein
MGTLSMLHPVPLLSISYILAGIILDIIDLIAGHTIAWWNQPNALVLGAGASGFVAYVIVITEIVRDVRYNDQQPDAGEGTVALDAMARVQSSVQKGRPDCACQQAAED